jgi:hypothetical protein
MVVVADIQEDSLMRERRNKTISRIAVILLCVFVVLCLVWLGSAKAEEMSARDVFKQTFTDFSGAVEHEAFRATEQSDGKEERIVEGYVDHANGDALVVGPTKVKNPKKRPTNMFISAVNGDLFGIANEFVNTKRKRNSKPKKNAFTSNVKGTQSTEADIWSFVFGEIQRLDDFNFTFLRKKERSYEIKVAPKDMQDGDYTHRVFYISSLEEAPNLLRISAIMYFDGEKSVKTQINSNFQKYVVNNIPIWRTNKTVIISKEGETVIEVEQRVFDQPFEVDADAQKNGRPRNWKWPKKEKERMNEKDNDMVLLAFAGFPGNRIGGS